jgi:Arc/MetJ-type ribon-helix-helix transcriptional regulator
MPKKAVPYRMGWIGARVPEAVEREVWRIVATEGYKDISDYVRELVRKDLRARGITLKSAKKVREVKEEVKEKGEGEEKGEEGKGGEVKGGRVVGD